MDTHTSWFCWNMPLTDDGVWLWPDIEAEIEFTVASSDGEIEIRAVNFEASRKEPHAPRKWASGSNMIDLLKAEDPTIRTIGMMIKTAAEADDEWQAEALAEAGYQYVGLGGNDPDGHFRRVA